MNRFKKRIVRIVSRFYLFSKIYAGTYNNVKIGHHCKIRFAIFGKNNTVLISPTTKIKKGLITICGSNSLIQIGNNCFFKNISLWLEDDKSKIIIGNKCSFCGTADIACIEEKQITIGDDLLVSNNVSIVNGDSHSILDKSGERINWSVDLSIGNNVWIGKNVCILKKGSVGSNTIIGANSLVTKDYSKTSNVLIAGSPAKIIRKNINWKEERIPLRK